MRSLIAIISKLAMASAIAQMALENPIDDASAKEAYQQLDDSAMAALGEFPGALSNKECKFVENRLSKFIDMVGWDNESHDVRKFMLFSSEQLSGIRYELVAHNADASKVAAIDRLISIEADIYDRYSDGVECTECAKEGIIANDTWDQIFNA